MSAPLPALTLDKFMTFLATTNGKDKLTKVLQYGAKFYAWYLASYTTDKKLTGEMNNLFKASAEARRLFRIFNEFALVQKLSTLNPAKLTDPLEALSLGQSASMAVYFLWDHMVWLAGNGIIDKTALPQYKKISAWGWLLGLVCGAVHATFKLLEGVDKEKKLLAKTERDSKELEAIRTQRQALTVSYLRFFGDGIIAAQGTELLTVSDGVIGAAGVVAAFEGFWAAWPQK